MFSRILLLCICENIPLTVLLRWWQTDTAAYCRVVESTRKKRVFAPSALPITQIMSWATSYDQPEHRKHFANRIPACRNNYSFLHLSPPRAATPSDAPPATRVTWDGKLSESRRPGRISGIEDGITAGPVFQQAHAWLGEITL